MGIYSEFMLGKNMVADVIQHIAIQMLQFAADFTLQMQVIRAILRLGHILITKAGDAVSGVTPEIAVFGHFFQMPVYRGAPDGGLAFPEIGCNLRRRHFFAGQGGDITQDGIPLSGIVIARSSHIARHNFHSLKVLF
jgi:hypothetical protein